jgi:hypothetical protein
MPMKPVKRGYKLWCLCDSLTGYLFNCQIYEGKSDGGDKEFLLGERVVFNLLADYNFAGKHLFFDNFFTSLTLLEKLKARRINATGTIRTDRLGNNSQFAAREKMKRGDYKSIASSGTITFKWMDTKHVFLASNDSSNTAIVTISRQLRDRQRITISCPQAIVDYNKYAHGVDRFNQRISCYNFDHRSRRNWLRLFFFFVNASLVNSYICHIQFAHRDISHLDYLISVSKSLCDGAERTSIGRPTSKAKEAGMRRQYNSTEDRGQHLPVRSTRKRCAYCSDKESQVRSNIECSTCKRAFCVTEKNCFFEFHKNLV